MAKKVKNEDEGKINDKMLEQLAKRLGVNNGDLTVASDHVSFSDVISTGHGELDSLICPSFFEKNGRGGIPVGFLCEFYGPNAGGKSSLCLKLAATVTRKMKGLVFWVDAEHSYMDDWAENHGVDGSRVIMCPEFEKGEALTGEGYLNKLEAAVSSGMFKLAVVDSMEALQPKEILEKDLFENPTMGAKARMMSRALPRIIHAAKQGNCTVIFINQIRNKIGVVYGDPETTPGGEALRFYSSLRLRISQVSGKANRGITKDDEEIGIRSNILIKKSRFGPPYKETVMSIYYGNEKPHPFDLLLDLAMDNKIIKSRTKKVKGAGAKEAEDVQTFTFDPVDKDGNAIPGFEELQKIEGFDEFKTLLDIKAINAIVDCLKVKKVSIDPEILFFVEEKNKEESTINDITGVDPTSE